MHHGWTQIAALAFSCKLLARKASVVSSVANLVMKAYAKLLDAETASFVKDCQEGLDKDSISSLIDDLDVTTAVRPLWHSPGYQRLDPHTNRNALASWQQLWVCVTAVCCPAHLDRASFERDIAG